MITAILDTNVYVRAAIGSGRGASYRVIEVREADKYRLVFSPDTIDELLQTLCVPHIRARHGWSDDEILNFVISFLADADIYPGRHPVAASLTRDTTDVKLLSLAAESGAEYLVSNDRRHLLRLRHYQRTRIVTPAQFLRELA